jgi:hypothetical protein
MATINLDKLHETIQENLNKFKQEADTDRFTFCFKSNPNVFSLETQIPELWSKTRQPFDKNSCFIIEAGNVLPKPNMFPK